MGDLTDSIWFPSNPISRSCTRQGPSSVVQPHARRIDFGTSHPTRSDATRRDPTPLPMTFTRLVPLLSSVECQVPRSVKPHSVIGNCRSAWGHGAKVKGRVWPYGIVHPQSPKAHSAPSPPWRSSHLMRTMTHVNPTNNNTGVV